MAISAIASHSRFGNASAVESSLVVIQHPRVVRVAGVLAENVAGAWCVGHSITSATLRAIQRASQAQIKAYVVPVISTAP
jgi:hypothetical protein